VFIDEMKNGPFIPGQTTAKLEVFGLDIAAVQRAVASPICAAVAAGRSTGRAVLERFAVQVHGMIEPRIDRHRRVVAILIRVVGGRYCIVVLNRQSARIDFERITKSVDGM
jgi:hypothetical protein